MDCTQRIMYLRHKDNVIIYQNMMKNTVYSKSGVYKLFRPRATSTVKQQVWGREHNRALPSFTPQLDLIESNITFTGTKLSTVLKTTSGTLMKNSLTFSAYA